MHRLCDSTAAPPVQCIHTHNLILMSSRSKKLLANLPGTLALIIAFGSIAYAGSWTNPPANPPGNNVDTPINVGSALQFKSGPLVLSNSLSVGGLLLASNGITVGSANAPSTGGIRASGDICTSAGGGKCLSQVSTSAGSWINVSFATYWENYNTALPGFGYQNVQYRKIGDIVYLRGLAYTYQGGVISQGPTLFYLPSGYRPASRLIFNILSNPCATRLDILPTGEVRYVGNTCNVVGPQWLSLEGIQFSTI